MQQNVSIIIKCRLLINSDCYDNFSLQFKRNNNKDAYFNTIFICH